MAAKIFDGNLNKLDMDMTVIVHQQSSDHVILCFYDIVRREDSTKSGIVARSATIPYGTRSDG